MNNILGMKISDEQLDAFIEIHLKKRGEVLDRQEAHGEAIRLLKLIELVESNTYKTQNTPQ